MVLEVVGAWLLLSPLVALLVGGFIARARSVDEAHAARALRAGVLAPARPDVVQLKLERPRA